jgi:hypothetical protein
MPLALSLRMRAPTEGFTGILINTHNLPARARRDGAELPPLVFCGLAIRADPQIDADAPPRSSCR